MNYKHVLRASGVFDWKQRSNGIVEKSYGKKRNLSIYRITATLLLFPSARFDRTIHGNGTFKRITLYGFNVSIFQKTSKREILVVRPPFRRSWLIRARPRAQSYITRGKPLTFFECVLNAIKISEDYRAGSIQSYKKKKEYWKTEFAKRKYRLFRHILVISNVSIDFSVDSMLVCLRNERLSVSVSISKLNQRKVLKN